MNPERKAYEEFLIRWLKAKKDHPSIEHGAEPHYKDFGFVTPQEIWEAEQIRKRIYKEIARTC